MRISAAELFLQLYRVLQHLQDTHDHDSAQASCLVQHLKRAHDGAPFQGEGTLSVMSSEFEIAGPLYACLTKSDYAQALIFSEAAVTAQPKHANWQVARLRHEISLV